MGTIFSKTPSLTKCLVSLEDKITKQEKKIIDLQNARSTMSFRMAVAMLLGLPCLLVYSYLTMNYIVSLLWITFGLLRYILLRWYTYRISRAIGYLGELRAKQKEQIEKLKKEESFMMTKKVIEKYETEGQKKTFFSKIRHRPKGVVDKVTDLVLGDDPNKMYALICSNCHYHNGMVHPTEYNMSNFHCYNCNFLNVRGNGKNEEK